MINIAICDDEPNIRTYLSSLVKKQDMECEITEYASADEYLSANREHDLLFLDIEMQECTPGEDDTDKSGIRKAACKSDMRKATHQNNMRKATHQNDMRKVTYRNGMRLAREIRSRDEGKQPVIIFVTGYQEYVFDAFDVDAFQYLLKPVDTQKFAEVFHRAAKRILAEQEHQRDASRRKNLIIQYKNTSKAIPFKHIYYVESRNHKAVIHSREGEFEYYARMEDLEIELSGQFYRIHRGYLLNLSCVDEYNKLEVTLMNGDKLPISKYKYNGFVRAYLDYMAGDCL